MVRNAVRQRLGTLIALPSEERSLALRAVFTLAVVRVAQRLLSPRRVHALVARAGRGRPMERDNATARAVRRAVDRAARTWPSSSCLALSLAGAWMLRRRGCEVRLSVGVAADGVPLDAHAWLESAGVLVTGDNEDIGRYQTLLVLGAADGERREATRA